MSLDKAIKHGDCPWCRKNRKHKNERRAPAPEEKEE